MRRFFCALLSLCVLCLALPALAQNTPLDRIFAAVEALNPDKLIQQAGFEQVGDWMSATVSQSGQIAPAMEGVQWYGLVFDMQTGEPIVWEDIFLDGDAAAAHLESIAENDSYANAYAEYHQISPMPRDSFALTEHSLTVYYPATQLSYFSGRSGGFSFYAYELEGLLKEGVPLARGDISQAAHAAKTALEEGALPGALADWKLGGAMLEAAGALSLVDVPDLTYDFAVYHFEAPEMRGVSLLSSTEEDNAETASIAGIYARRIDFSGLITGVTTREECVSALGAPDLESAVETADAYGRLPVGETLGWAGSGRVLELHFVDGILHSVTLRVV